MTDFKDHLLGQPQEPLSYAEQEQWLRDHGFLIMDRNLRANTDHAGRYMVIDADTLSMLEKTELTFVDAGNLDGGWCLVGDDVVELVKDTFDMHFEGETS